MDDPPRPGLRAGALRLAATLMDIGHTRLQLAVTEIEEERLHLSRQLVAAAVALALACLGLLAGSAWLVLVSPAAQRPAVLAALCVGYWSLGLAALWQGQRLAARKPPLLQTTLAELRSDAAWLRPAEPQ